MKYSVRINSGRRRLVNISCFEINEGKISFLFGESGIGKSILCKAIYGLLDPDELKVTINETDYEKYCQSPQVKTIQSNGFFVFQEPSSHLNPLLSLKNQLTEGSLKDLSTQDELSIIKYLWQGADPAFLKRLLKVFPKPYRPSGGEKQRILLVMAFKKIKKYIDDPNIKTALFIFDEPTGSLDNTYRDLFLQLLMECYKQKPFTAVIITHDYSIISHIEQNYLELTDTVKYREIARQNGNIVLSGFNKDEYLSWIKKQKVEESSIVNNGHSILKINSGIKIFDKTLSFHRAAINNSSGILELKRGELVYLKAKSGVGKTTVAKIIMGLIKPQALQMGFGKYLVTQDSGESFWKKNIWGKTGSMIFQHADESLNQNASVLETFKALSKNRKVSKQKILGRVQELFESRVPVSFLDKKIKYLSGGQKQRINILRSMVLDTDVLIMDEPLNGLDLRSSHKVLEKIKQKQVSGKAILLISHNEEIFDKIVKPENIYYLKAV